MAGPSVAQEIAAYAENLERAYISSLRAALREAMRVAVMMTKQDSGNAAAHWLYVDSNGNRFDHELMQPTDMRITGAATGASGMVGRRREERSNNKLEKRTAYHKVALETSKYISQLRESNLPDSIYLYNSVQELGPEPYVKSVGNFDAAGKAAADKFKEVMLAQITNVGQRSRRRR
jgi:hypothetical protein